ncbi:hypothetical protein A2480_00545 [Candidatus Uhrbacteria bacterium RIFOXYC2_FULL_47_19]|uniref:Uncharacterized protein n=1 Tax=Candidatus Uhrbacteria bacterium RIFOXYC2_FULL_47_19 TaxID=1802424 RepID=A0A1F7WDF9_9BACT|nr:MAG: hypothetical protein A2480_00545 [Candidatus Uhrbacteria bacterium RIFOXYC2_FULL_47_19]HAB53992.1 hypothetical protein [Ignavibacteriales bacterium]
MKQEKHQSTQEKIKKVEVRELAPEEFWGGSVTLGELSEEEFAQRIGEVANELSFTYSGYRVSGNYYFSRYPRRAFGPVAPVGKYQEALQKLAEKLGTVGNEEKKSEQPKFRVLLGLQEGYAEHKKRGVIERIGKGEITDIEKAKEIVRVEIDGLSEVGIDIDKFSSIEELRDVIEKTNLGKNHTLAEVQEALGEGFDLVSAEIYSAGSWGKYTEPAIIIEGDKSQLQKVYALAEKFRQARIAVEDLQDGQAHMVETKYCEDPDKE